MKVTIWMWGLSCFLLFATMCLALMPYLEMSNASLTSTLSPILKLITIPVVVLAIGFFCYFGFRLFKGEKNVEYIGVFCLNAITCKMILVATMLNYYGH